MISRKTLILSVAIAVVATVPAVAWAVGDPFGTDPRPPTTGGDAETDAPYGWMDQMHEYMWNNGELPEDFPARGGCGMWGGPERSETTPGT